MSYDVNGNLVKDLDRDIVTIKYNLLNLPDIVQFKNGNQIRNLYDAGGRKLRAEYATLGTPVVVPIGSIGSAGDPTNCSDYVYGTEYMDNYEYSFDNDCGNYQMYIDKVYNAEGYVQSGFYYYYRKDHLGNNREVWKSPSFGGVGEAVQRTQYYPSGLPWSEGTGQDLQNKKYNGKEFVEAHGYDETDLGNRGLYHAINRFTSIDRFCEKYPWQSPYVFAANNPVNYVDVNGDSIWVEINTTTTNPDGTSNSSTQRYYYGQDADGNYGFIGSDGKIYSGNDSFVNSLNNALGDLRSGGEVGNSLVNDLMTSTDNVLIMQSGGKNRSDMDNGKYIYWNPNGTNGGLNKLGNTYRPAFIGLAHEMAHVQDVWNGTINRNEWLSSQDTGTKPVYEAEKYATDIENKIRAENGITLREFYSPTRDYRVQLIDKKGKSIYFNHYYYRKTVFQGYVIFNNIWNY